MKCLVNPKYFCYRQWRTGKGKWDYAKDICQNCEIFIKTKQIPLEVIEMRKQAAKNWVEAKKKQLELERKAHRKEQGMEDLYTMTIGETEIEVDPNVEPRTAETKFGKRDILRIYVGETREAKDWMINPNSPLYLTVLENISIGKCHMVIVRSGLEKQTRYSIKNAW